MQGGSGLQRLVSWLPRGKLHGLLGSNPGGGGEGRHTVSLMRDVPARGSFGGGEALAADGGGQGARGHPG